MPKAKLTRFVTIRRNPKHEFLLIHHGVQAGDGSAPVAHAKSARSARAVLKRWRRQFGAPQQVFGEELLEKGNRQGAKSAEH